jgi:hypothetical protein
LEEEDLITDTSHDSEFTQRLYDELNHAILGPPANGKIIILSDSNEEEVYEEKTTRRCNCFCCSQPYLDCLHWHRRCPCGGKK